ncbi:MAG: DUF4340 domain-containing protein [Deltaproteobacteria bacterium]|nr:DUF4340 domain-containing protein [Deltaproteobacteria bacterium]
MSKLNRLLLIALVVQILIVGLVGARDEPKVAQPTPVFPGFDADKVTTVEVAGFSGFGDDKKPQSVKLSKEGTAWGVADAEGYPVAKDKIDTFLKNVGKLKAGSPVVTKEAFHPKLEVSPTEYQRKVTLTHDGKPMSFFLGSSPGFKKIHVRKDGEKEVYLAEELSAWDVGSKASDWVERSYLKVPDADVWAMTLHNAQGTIQLEKGLDGSWAMAGATLPVKKSSVEDVVRKAASITVDAPMGKSVKPEYGFEAPLAEVTLVTGTSTIAGMPPKITTTRTIKVGAKVEDKSYYVKASDQDFVITAAKWSMDPLVTKAMKDLVEEPKKEDPKKSP